MQDIHSIGGGGGRFFGGPGVDRRLRPNHHQNHHQALKCPRCDSLNTKFCYYNNYNLSQPRHFCKSCRRYWTKGGVLRNVPVGGGCRKAKRSKPKAVKSSNSHSSSESSSLTASTTAATTSASTAAAGPEVVSVSPSTSASALLNFPDSRFFNMPLQTSTPSFDPPLMDQSSDGGIFPEIGSFTSMMTSSNDPSFLGFNIAGIPASEYRLHQENHESVVQDQSSNHQWEHQHKMQEISAGFLDQTAQMDLSGAENRANNGGVGPLDWQAGGDQGLYDFTASVDQAYWSQNQWPDHNGHSLYLP